MSELVHAFFSQWEIYRLCIEHNTLFHREVGGILRRDWLARPTPFSFLDLACGDAGVTGGALQGTKISSYTGVDFSAPAIALAAKNTATLPGPRHFHEEDFPSFLHRTTETFDLIYLGLSLHHLETAAKRETLRDLHRTTAEGGFLYLFEPILQSGESRESYVERWAAAMDGPYDPFPPAVRTALQDHVRESERPESVEEYLASAHRAGFSPGEVLFTDPGHFYALFRFKA